VTDQNGDLAMTTVVTMIGEANGDEETNAQVAAIAAASRDAALGPQPRNVLGAASAAGAGTGVCWMVSRT
jgi:hypothetical protein